MKKSALILGSGGLRIGQAGEFDYSGSQAIKALKEEGLKTILINPNIATVQTDPDMADVVYLQPLNVKTVERIIEQEKPHYLLLSFGGQTALNLGLELEAQGILKKHGIEVLGTPVESIRLTEDRNLFKQHLDRIGIHTAKSIAATTVEAALAAAREIGYPVMMRSFASAAARYLNIVGECNVQFALDPKTSDYLVIEMNARLSRSSALASKATGYPLAFVAAKLALGYNLHEVANSITKKTTAFFEPALDYIVVKIPRWDTQKLKTADRTIGTEMKSVGEIMAIGRSFPEAIQKGIRMLNLGSDGLSDPPDQIDAPVQDIQKPTDRRLFALYQFFAQGGSLAQAHEYSFIDPWFLQQIFDLARFEKEFANGSLSPESLLEAKRRGFSDAAIARLHKKTEESIRTLRLKHRILPYIKQI